MIELFVSEVDRSTTANGGVGEVAKIEFRQPRPKLNLYSNVDASFISYTLVLRLKQKQDSETKLMFNF